MSNFIRDFSAGTPEMRAVFGDEALIRHALAFESALAGACASEGLIDSAAARAIADTCLALKPDPATVAREAAHAGTLAIPLVALLRRQVANPSVAAAVHVGATSQDVADTALVLQIKDALPLLERDLTRATAALRQLASAHAKTPMIGRTLLQPALPITFGLKCAQWLVSLRDDAARIRRDAPAALTLQLGGAVGTRDAFKNRGGAIMTAVANSLGLTPSPLPWHTRRGNLVGLANAVALLVVTLGKIAQDIALMAQGEVAEVAEPLLRGRGGSSVMPHKRNPTGCQVALSAATRAPGLMASLLTGAINAHERGLGGWQAEASLIADMFLIAHGALQNMAAVLEGLDVHTDAMARNLSRSGVGVDVGEAEALVATALALYDGGGA